jgi:hypothetical protein
LAKFDYAGDADDFPSEHGDPLVSRYFWPNCNERGERLIGVFSSETDTCGPERAYGDRDNQAAHFDAFTNVLNGFRILKHSRMLHTRYAFRTWSCENWRASRHYRRTPASETVRASGYRLENLLTLPLPIAFRVDLQVLFNFALFWDASRK